MGHYASLSLIDMLKVKLGKSDQVEPAYHFTGYYPPVYPSTYDGPKAYGSITVPVKARQPVAIRYAKDVKGGVLNGN